MEIGEKHSVNEQIELTELRKLIKKKIKEDVIRRDEEIAQIIIKSTWSTK